MDKCPILVDVVDPDWMNEVRMVAAVTGRAMVMVDKPGACAAVANVLKESRATGPCAGTVGIFVSDRPHALEDQPRLRKISLNDLPRTYELGGALDLARLVGMHDRPVVAVHGAIGGAGTTILSACLAQALDDRNLSVALVDANPTSLGMDIVLGVEAAAASSRVELTESLTFEAIESSAPRVGQIPMLPAPGYGETVPPAPLLECLRAAALDAALVVDCGVARPGTSEYSQIMGDVRPDFHVVATTNTVAGLMYARMTCERIEEHTGTRPQVVVRTRHKSELPQALAGVLLQHYPLRRVFTDPRVAKELDKGCPENVLHNGHHLVRIAHELLGQWEAENYLIVDDLVAAGDVDRPQVAL